MPVGDFAGSSSQAAVNCYLGYGSNRQHRRFRAQWPGLFECVLRTVPLLGAWASSRPPFGGINPAVGSNVMYFPERTFAVSGDCIDRFTRRALPIRCKRVRKIDLALSYTSRAIAPISRSPTAAAAIIRLSLWPRTTTVRIAAISDPRAWTARTSSRSLPPSTCRTGRGFR